MMFGASLLTTLIAIVVFFSSNRISNQRHRLSVRAIALLIGTLAVFSSLFRTLIVIPAGNIGIVDLFGNVSERPLNPGVHIVNPFAKVVKFSTRLRDIKENLDTTSQEGLNMNIDVSLQYKLDPQKAADVYKTIGTNETGILISRFRSKIRQITANYPANSIYSSSRQEIAKQLDQELTQQLLPLGFVVEETLLRKVELPQKVQAAIQQKLQAEQESQQMKFVLQKENQEAERKRLEAKGIADAHKIISQGLNAQVLQLRMIEAHEKLAQSNNAKVLILGGSDKGLPLILPSDSVTTNR